MDGGLAAAAFGDGGDVGVLLERGGVWDALTALADGHEKAWGEGRPAPGDSVLDGLQRVRRGDSVGAFAEAVFAIGVANSGASKGIPGHAPVLFEGEQAETGGEDGRQDLADAVVEADRARRAQLRFMLDVSLGFDEFGAVFSFEVRIRIWLS
jgi:hypothetical protein